MKFLLTPQEVGVPTCLDRLQPRSRSPMGNLLYSIVGLPKNLYGPAPRSPPLFKRVFPLEVCRIIGTGAFPCCCNVL